MKLKELPYVLGIRPGVRVHGSEVHDFDLPREERIQYGQWLPLEQPKTIRQGAVDALRTFLRPGDVAIDMSAHHDVFCAPTA
jgi:hypothetical protein